MHAEFYQPRPAAKAALQAEPREVRMNKSAFIRRSHRWIAMAFTLLVAANFVAFSFGQPPLWLVYAPLPPLFLLMAGGLIMFFQPYRARRRARIQEANA